MKVSTIMATLFLTSTVVVRFAAGSPNSIQSILNLAATSAKENGAIAGSAVCAEHIKELKTNVAYEQCMTVVDAQIEPQSQKIVAQSYQLAAYHSDQEVYAFCDDNVDRLTRKGYAACYTYGSDAPRGR